MIFNAYDPPRTLLSEIGIIHTPSVHLYKAYICTWLKD
jgi:hypothetical protein